MQVDGGLELVLMVRARAEKVGGGLELVPIMGVGEGGRRS